MPMTPFQLKFPGIARCEMRRFIVEGRNDLPDGEYAFYELLCNEDGCDCRRVILNAVRLQPEPAHLATINYGWEPLAYYREWVKNATEGPDIKGPSLDPLNVQSACAPALLEEFRQAIRDPAYPALLQQHYRLFKATLDEAAALLSPAQIAAELRWNHGVFPEAALLAALARREEITPFLLDALEDVCQRPEERAKDDAYFAPIYAMFLLAQLREPRAFPLLLRFARLPGDLTFDLTGDIVTEDFCRILASVCGGHIWPIKALIEDPAANEYVRAAGLRALQILFGVGQLSRDELVAYHRHLLQGALERKASFIWDALVGRCLDIHPGEVMDEILRAYQEGLVDPDCAQWESVEEIAAQSVESVMADFRRYSRGLIDDVIEDLRWWDCFDCEEDDDEEIYLPQEGIITTCEKPYSRPDIKTGRNDPCPCGSGKKYKKCCGQ